MRHKLTFLIGFTTGYTLGSRAGRERYEQIVRLARTIADNPAVQSTAGLIQAQASGMVSTAARRARDTVASAVGGRDVTQDAAPYPDSMPGPY